jgi:hypothetical protein
MASHNDTTTTTVEWKSCGAHPPAGVPPNYGLVDWTLAVEAEGAPLVWWNFGLMPDWGPEKVLVTTNEINDLVARDQPPWFLTGDNGAHETGPGPMENRMPTLDADIHQRLGYAAFKASSRYHARTVAQPHGAVHITKLIKHGQPDADHPKYEWRRIAYIDVMIDGEKCVDSDSANAETVGKAVPLRIVMTHTVSPTQKKPPGRRCL